MDMAETIVKQAVDALNADGRRQALPWDRNTSLQLDDGFVDSLDLMDLITAVEKGVASECGASVSLADEELFDPETTPFATIGDLVDHVKTVMGA